MQWCYKGYYSHGQILQGYTNRGQILGAGSGYFGNSQYAGIKFYYPRGSATLALHRSCPDNNYIYNKTVGNAINSSSQEYEDYYAVFKTFNTLSLGGLYFITKDFCIEGSAAYSRILNSTYTNTERPLNNFYFTLAAKYNF